MIILSKIEKFRVKKINFREGGRFCVLTSLVLWYSIHDFLEFSTALDGIIEWLNQVYLSVYNDSAKHSYINYINRDEPNWMDAYYKPIIINQMRSDCCA